MASRSRWIVPGILLMVAVAGSLALRAGPEAAHVEGGAPDAPASASPKSTHPPPVRPGVAESPQVREDEARSEGEAEGDGAEARRLGERMARLVRDLEYTPGLPEPVQQTVKPQPEPWRSDPSREGPPPVVEEIAPHRVRAEGGERVTIRGKNLRVVQVMFGTEPGKLLAASDTQIAVEAPPSPPGPVTIVITNDDGTWALAPEPLTYER